MVLLIAAWLLALGIGCFIVIGWKKRMNTALPQTQAAAYVVPGSLNFTTKKDSFLYSKVNKTKRTSSGSAGSMAGRALSSGMGHGGRGGRR